MLTTKAGIGGIAFPVCFILLVALRRYLMPRIMKVEELVVLDPTDEDYEGGAL